MKKANITIHDIARELNTSSSTVSRALNNTATISHSLKSAILSTAQRMNYQPNNLAKALRIGRSKIIGIVVPTFDRSFFSSAIRAMEEVAMQKGYNVILCQTQEDGDKEKASIRALLKSKVEGIILSCSKGTTSFSHLEDLQDSGVPLILFDRTTEEVNVSQVGINDFLGAYDATVHLIGQGCRRIAHFTSTSKIHLFKERQRGYEQALFDYGIAFDESFVVESTLQSEGGETSIKQLFDRGIRIDGILSASALAALGAISILKERGLSVPGDVAVVGFSDELAARFSEPPLTVVDQHSALVGTVSAELLFDRIMGSPRLNLIPERIMFPPSLLIRNSSLTKSSRMRLPSFRFQ